MIGNTASCSLFRADLVLTGDVRWRAVTPTTPAAWLVSASADTEVVANTGEDDAYPVITLEPVESKTTNRYAYKRYQLVTWRAINAGDNYPIRLGPLDTDALTVAKMQADGDDLRVFVDGKEVSRYLVDMDTAATYVWFSADWRPAKTALLRTAIAGAGDIDVIELAYAADGMQVVSGWDEVGFVRIDNEVLSYTGRDFWNNYLTGVTRAVWGTAAGAHSSTPADTVYWMQHEIIIVYGDPAAVDPPDSLTDKPMFSLAVADSDNEEWKFEEFGQTIYPLRPATWTPNATISTRPPGGAYSKTEWTLGSPFTVMGLYRVAKSGPTFYNWPFYNACGIVNATWADGKKRVVDMTEWSAHISVLPRGSYGWTGLYDIPAPNANDVYQNWSHGPEGADFDPVDQIDMYLFVSTYLQVVEVGTVTLSLNTDETPVVPAMGAELGNYTLAATITNETTGESITLNLEMAEDEELEIDTPQFLVTYLLDNSNQFQAIALSSARRAWLRLLPGNNTLRFDDVGMAVNGVQVTITFERRYY